MKRYYGLEKFIFICVLIAIGFLWGIGPFSRYGSTESIPKVSQNPLIYNSTTNHEDKRELGDIEVESDNNNDDLIKELEQLNISLEQLKAISDACPNCKNGLVYDIYGNSYLCSTCEGSGVISTSGNSNITFTGGRFTCRSHGCDCGITRAEIEAAGLNYCSCGHSVSFHHN